MSLTTENIRNIAVAGHGQTGKSSLVEQILFNGGTISRAEAVESGKSVSDYSPEENERQLSVYTSLSQTKWENVKINLLDTPGTSDFVGEVVAGLRTSESGLVMVSADSGVEIETLKVWRRLNQRNMPRMIFINKMDKTEIDFPALLDNLKENFNKPFVPVSIPMGSGNDFSGVIDLIEQKAYPIPEAGKMEKAQEVPDNIHEYEEEYHERVVESAAEGDDELLEKYLEQGTLTDEEIKRGLIEGLRDNRVVPVFCGSATNNSGLHSLMNFLAFAAPSPAGIKETTVSDDGEETEVQVTEEGDFSAFVWHTKINQFYGRMSFIKVITGSISNDSEVYNAEANKKEKISKVYTALGGKMIEEGTLTAGDIGVLTKMETVNTNDTLTVNGKNFKYKPLQVPQPVHSVSIFAKAKKDEDKLNQFLHKTAEEDLTFQVNYNKETKETVISGMGELHLEVILNNIKSAAKIDMDTKVPKIAYRETITKSADAEHTHKKQSGGHGQFARVFLEIEPLPRGEQFEFNNDIKGGAISKGFIPGVEKGIIEAMESGIIAGYPVVDVKSRVYDGKEHPVDSSEMAFKLASRNCFQKAMEKAKPVLLEPVMNLTVFIDEQYLGDVLSDISSRRGKVQGQENMGGGIIEIKGQVPQAELLRYAIDLRSITSGTGSFEIEFDHYNPISGKIADDVIEASKAAAESE